MLLVNKDKRLIGFLNRLYIVNKYWEDIIQCYKTKWRHWRCPNSNINASGLNKVEKEEYSNASIIKSFKS